MFCARKFVLATLTLFGTVEVLNARDGFDSLPKQIATSSDREMIRLVEDCAIGEGNLAILEELKTRPRTELHRALKRIQDNQPLDSALRVKVAFVSCLLGFDYGSNVQIVSQSLTKEPKYEKFWADDAAGLISGLLAATDDNSLLRVLFASSDWSDGALSEQLASTFTRRAKEDTMKFLNSIRSEPETRRRKIYRLFNDTSLSREDLESLRKRLSLVRRNSPVGLIAREMFEAIS